MRNTMPFGLAPCVSIRRAGQAAALGLFFLSARASAQGDNTKTPSAETWFHLGKMLAAQGKTQQAYEAYLSAWKLNPNSPEVACNLGDIELTLSHYRDAAEHLSFCSSHFPVTATEKQRKAAKSRFEDARKRVGSITIELTPEHAAVSVDGSPAGESPLGNAIFVEPGTHTIKMEHEGYLPAEKQINIARGEQISLSEELKPKPAAPPPPNVQTSSPIGSIWPVFLTGGLTLTGIGVGVGMLLGSNSKQDKANTLWVDLARQDGRGACNLKKNEDNCNQLDAASSQSSLFFGLSIGGFVTGGVAAVATGVFLWRALSGPSPAARTDSARLIVHVSPRGGMLGVQAVF